MKPRLDDRSKEVATAVAIASLSALFVGLVDWALEAIKSRVSGKTASVECAKCEEAK